MAECKWNLYVPVFSFAPLTLPALHWHLQHTRHSLSVHVYKKKSDESPNSDKFAIRMPHNIHQHLFYHFRKQEGYFIEINILWWPALWFKIIDLYFCYIYQSTSSLQGIAILQWFLSPRLLRQYARYRLLCSVMAYSQYNVILKHSITRGTWFIATTVLAVGSVGNIF